MLAVRFWLLPGIERYRDDIVAAVSRTVGQPVRIGAIEAGWLGLNPRLNLHDVRIYDREGREALVLPSVENVLSWSALARGKLKVHSLAIEGLRLQVRRDAAGALYGALQTARRRLPAAWLGALRAGFRSTGRQFLARREMGR